MEKQAKERIKAANEIVVSANEEIRKAEAVIVGAKTDLRVLGEGVVHSARERFSLRKKKSAINEKKRVAEEVIVSANEEIRKAEAIIVNAEKEIKEAKEVRYSYYLEFFDLLKSNINCIVESKINQNLGMKKIDSNSSKILNEEEKEGESIILLGNANISSLSGFEVDKISSPSSFIENVSSGVFYEFEDLGEGFLRSSEHSRESIIGLTDEESKKLEAVKDLTAEEVETLIGLSRKKLNLLEVAKKQIEILRADPKTRRKLIADVLKDEFGYEVIQSSDIRKNEPFERLGRGESFVVLHDGNPRVVLAPYNEEMGDLPSIGLGELKQDTKNKLPKSDDLRVFVVKKYNEKIGILKPLPAVVKEIFHENP